MNHPADSSGKMIKKNTPTTTDRQIVGLDLLRFVASLLVMAHHFGFLLWSLNIVPVSYRYLGPFSWFGFIGVEIFFVLSGFIISYTAHTATPGSFVRNRVIRLYPTIWICSTITLAVLLTQHPTATLLADWARAMSLFPFGTYIDPSYWTLPIEVSFYSLTWLLLVRKQIRRLGMVMSAVGLISSFSWVAYIAMRRGHIAPQTILGRYLILFSTKLATAHLLLLDYGCYFAIGVLFYLCFADRVTLSRLLVLACCFCGAIAEIHHHSLSFGYAAVPGYSLIIPPIIWVLAMAAVLSSVRWNPAIRRFVGDRGAALSRFLGLITYPLYLLHQKIGYALIGFLRGFVPDIAATAAVSIFLIALSLGVHVGLEQPLQGWLRRVLPGRRRRPLAQGQLP